MSRKPMPYTEGADTYLIQPRRTVTTSYRDRFFPLSARVELGRATARHFADTAAKHAAAATRLDAKDEPLAARNQRAHARQAALTGALHAITAVAAATACAK